MANVCLAGACLGLTGFGGRDSGLTGATGATGGFLSTAGPCRPASLKKPIVSWSAMAWDDNSSAVAANYTELAAFYFTTESNLVTPMAICSPPLEF